MLSENVWDGRTSPSSFLTFYPAASLEPEIYFQYYILYVFFEENETLTIENQRFDLPFTQGIFFYLTVFRVCILQTIHLCWKIDEIYASKRRILMNYKKAMSVTVFRFLRKTNCVKTY